MCGRYDLSENPAAIRAKFAVPSVPDFFETVPDVADVRPTDRAPIVRLGHDGARKCALARWGLVPPWAKDLSFGTRCINARAETVASLATYRVSYAKRRCLVPLVAFYEWSGPKGKRIKHRITMAEEPLFALAGLWEWWRDPAMPDAPGVESYTIITSEANSAVAPLHDRMPVILRASQYDAWLDHERDPADLLKPFDGGLKIA
jgi:putative SOS response-associated peptidase YedK